MEQRVEPAKKAAQLVHKKLQGCMQSQSGLEAEKRMVHNQSGPSDPEPEARLVTSDPVPAEKAPADAAVHQHGRESQRLRRRVLHQVNPIQTDDPSQKSPLVT